MDWRIVSVLFLLFLAGCTSGSGGSNSGSSGGSSQGLAFSFIEGAPPEEVTREEPFSITLEIENKGGYDIPAFKQAGGIFSGGGDQEICMVERAKNNNSPENPSFRVNTTLTGIFYRDFGVSNATDFSIFPEATTLNNDDNITFTSPSFTATKTIDDTVIPGARTLLSFSNLAYNQNLNARTSLDIRANLCYQYGVQATGLFCIVEDPTEEDLFCDPTDPIELDVSDGHVNVEVKESVVGKNNFRLTFTFTKKSGNGVLLKPWSGNECTASLSASEPFFNRPDSSIDKENVRDAHYERLGETWRCLPPSTARLREQDRVFVDINVDDLLSPRGTLDMSVSKFSCRGFIEKSLDPVFAINDDTPNDGETSKTAGFISLKEPATVVCSFVVPDKENLVDEKRFVDVEIIYNYFDSISEKFDVIDTGEDS